MGIGHGAWGMGHGAWGLEKELLPITNYQFPMPIAPCPIPNHYKQL
ncbi:hypothetical protein [Tolypothrix sp. VBCCA 56010]